MSDPISRSDAIGAKPEYRNEDMLDKEKSTYNKGWNDCNDAWVAIIKALPSAEPTGELISKADAIELLTKIVFDEPPYLDSETLCRKYAEEQINTLPSAENSNAKTQNSNQETQKSNGDLIYRADAIDAICKVWCYTTYGMCPHDDGYCKGCDEIEAIDTLPSADAVSRDDYEKIKNMVSTQFQTVLEDYLELEKRYVALLGKQSQKPSAEAVPHGRLIDADALYKKATDLWDKSDSEDFEKGIFKLILNAVSAQTVQCGKENEFIQILKSWETNKVDAISKRFVSDAILQKISELNAQGEKAIPIAREFIRFKRFVDGLTPIITDAGQGDGIPIELKKRYPHSRDEDITDAFMRGYQAHGEAVQGEWVRKYDDKVNCYWYECDQCGEYRPRNQFGHEYNANFCPNCGARMKGGDDE